MAAILVIVVDVVSEQAVQVSRVDHTGDLGLKERAAKVKGLLRAFAEQNPELVARFTTWVRARFHRDNRRVDEVRAEDVLVPGRMETMLETAIEEFAKKERDEARREALVETARRLLAMGIPPSEVAEATGLPFEEVQKLAH